MNRLLCWFLGHPGWTVVLTYWHDTNCDLVRCTRCGTRKEVSHWLDRDQRV